MKHRTGDKALNLDSSSSRELKRQPASQEGLSLEDSAVIPNIEDWLKGRSQTEEREILKHGFEDTSYQ